MFIGECHHTIDDKGRYIVPAGFREELGEVFYITKGLDHCLFVYTVADWQAKVAELERLSSTNSNARRFARSFFSAAQQAVPDKQGRILLSSALRKHAGLLKDVVTLGVSNRLEIWDCEYWERYNEDGADEYEAVAEKLADICL